MTLTSILPMPNRFFMKATLHKEKEQAYIDEHDNIYPEVSNGLRAAGVINLHIWKDGLHLCMLIEREDGKDCQFLVKAATIERVRREWWNGRTRWPQNFTVDGPK